MSRDSVLVMFFYMRLEKHLCNAMSHNLLLAPTVVSFDHFVTSPVDKVVVRDRNIVTCAIMGAQLIRRIQTQLKMS
jgi:hypothetical protein